MVASIEHSNLCGIGMDLAGMILQRLGKIDRLVDHLDRHLDPVAEDVVTASDWACFGYAQDLACVVDSEVLGCLH